jgi:AmmeMemoRadiSam system protein B
MNIRQPAVAGTFYEAGADRLRQHVTALLADAPCKSLPIPQALIVPHAGYIYSGATAAEAYRLLQPLAGKINRVLLFGPAHRVALQGVALPSVDAFATPLGDIPLDKDSIERACALPGVCLSDEAHREEHSLEVQLPFLQCVLEDFSLVPVVVGHCPAATVAAVMDALWGGPETLRVVSTDLSHFHAYEDAQERDALTCARLLAKEHSLSGQDACGAYALNGLMSSEHGQSLDIDLINSCNSGDTAGTKQRVVGYGAFALH